MKQEAITLLIALALGYIVYKLLDQKERYNREQQQK